jgi:SAM-dependent methyltransferase
VVARLKGIDKVNLGCGPKAQAGWVNVDGSWNAWLSNHPHLRSALERVRLIKSNHGSEWKLRPLVRDLTKPLPFRDDSISAIYGAHVLEHLYLEDAQRLLSECKRVLQTGGVLRLVVPDLRSMVAAYLNNKNGGSSFSERIAAADKLNERLGFRDAAPPDGNPFYKFYSLWKDFHHHKWMYDAESLIHYVELAGFQEVSQKEFLQSDIPGIKSVEESSRVLEGAGICIEGKKL